MGSPFHQDRDEASLAQIREDESWNDFYASLDVEAEIEADRAYDERFLDDGCDT